MTAKLKAHISSSCSTAIRVIRRHAYFVGPGIVASVAYADPGNWATDLQAGSEFGYSLLFIVLLTGIFAVFIQILSCRVGVVTNADLARQCRMLILKEDRHGNPTQLSLSHPKLRRWALLYPLYVVCEGAIVATELAELTGSAIALNLLFPALPLWAGILVTSVDVILILFVYRPPPNGSFRILEGLIAVLIFTVLACFIVLLVRIEPNWKGVFKGYLPSHSVVESGALYVSVGILGATVMPHAIILGSHFASIDRLPNLDKVANTDREEGEGEGGGNKSTWELVKESFGRVMKPKKEVKAEVVRLSRVVGSLIRNRGRSEEVTDGEVQRYPLKPDDLPPRSLSSIRIHINHASLDIALSLIGFAIVINSAILIVAAAAFYYSPNLTPGSVVIADLYDAFYLLKARLGSLAAVLFAVALLAAGQSASITVTLAGQLVSEGFINWKTDPFLRRVVTRLVAVVPSLVVSLAVGKSGLDDMLVASQVALSVALPFVLLPLILVTGSRGRMMVEELDTDTVVDSVRSSVELEEVGASAAGRTSAVEEEGVSKRRPQLHRDVGASATIEVIQTLPLEPATPPALEEATKKPAPQPAPPVDGPSSSRTQEQEAPVRRKKQHSFASKWYTQVVAWAIFAVVSHIPPPFLAGYSAKMKS